MPNTCRQSHNVGRRANMDMHTQNRRYMCSRLERPNTPGGSTKLSADEVDGLESCPSMLSIHTHMYDISDGSNTPEYRSEVPCSPGRGTKLRKDYHSNLSDTCRDVKDVRNNPVVLENMSEIIRRTQNAW